MIIVKGEMPKGCIEKENGKYSECERRIDCIYSDNNLINIRPYCCPIVGEIPDKHGRIIDEKWVELYILKYFPAEFPNEMEKVYKLLKLALKDVPTILEASK